MNISIEATFAALAHNTRLRCLLLLQQRGELCVCELTGALAAAQPNVSRHLAHLREAGLVTDRREGLWIHYRINPALPAWVLGILRHAATATAGRPPFTTDLERLATRSARCG